VEQPGARIAAAASIARTIQPFRNSGRTSGANGKHPGHQQVWVLLFPDLDTNFATEPSLKSAWSAS